MKKNTRQIVLCIGGILMVLILGFFIYFFFLSSGSKKSNEEFKIECPVQMADSPTYPQAIYPPPNPKNICTKADGTPVKCGYESRDSEQIKEMKKLESDPQFMGELKLCNSSPLTLDIYHRPVNGSNFVFVATIPSMKEMYVYGDKKGGRFYANSELFATQHGSSKIIYLSVPLVPGKKRITWGLSTSDIDEGQTIVNLLGEIGHIKFRNYSLVPYQIYYYGEYLGRLEPYNRTKDVYFELYVSRSQGYRWGSKVTLQMEGIKGSVPAQSIQLLQRTMTTLNVGLVLMDLE